MQHMNSGKRVPVERRTRSPNLRRQKSPVLRSHSQQPVVSGTAPPSARSRSPGVGSPLTQRAASPRNHTTKSLPGNIKTICVCPANIWCCDSNGGLDIRDKSGNLLRRPPASPPPASRALCLTCIRGVVWAGFSTGLVRAYDSRTGGLLHEKLQHAGSVLCILGSGANVFSGSNDCKVVQWAATTGEVVRTLSEHVLAVKCLCASGKYLFTGSDDCSVVMWDVTVGTPKKRLQQHTKAVLCLQKYNDNLWSAGEDNTIIVWDCVSFEVVAHLRAHSNAVTQLTVVGTEVWSGSADHTIIAWEPLTHQQLRKFRHSGTITALTKIVLRPEEYTVWMSDTNGNINVYTTTTTSSSSNLKEPSLVPRSPSPPPFSTPPPPDTTQSLIQTLQRSSERSPENNKAPQQQQQDIATLQSRVNQLTADKQALVESNQRLQSTVEQLQNQQHTTRTKQSTSLNCGKDHPIENELREAKDKLLVSMTAQRNLEERYSDVCDRLLTLEKLETEVEQLVTKFESVAADLLCETVSSSPKESTVAKVQWISNLTTTIQLKVRRRNITNCTTQGTSPMTMAADGGLLHCTTTTPTRITLSPSLDSPLLSPPHQSLPVQPPPPFEGASPIRSPSPTAEPLLRHSMAPVYVGAFDSPPTSAAYSCTSMQSQATQFPSPRSIAFNTPPLSPSSDTTAIHSKIFMEGTTSNDSFYGSYVALQQWREFHGALISDMHNENICCDSLLADLAKHNFFENEEGGYHVNNTNKEMENMLSRFPECKVGKEEWSKLCDTLAQLRHAAANMYRCITKNKKEIERKARRCMVVEDEKQDLESRLQQTVDELTETKKALTPRGGTVEAEDEMGGTSPTISRLDEQAGTGNNNCSSNSNTATPATTSTTISSSSVVTCTTYENSSVDIVGPSTTTSSTADQSEALITVLQHDNIHLNKQVQSLEAQMEKVQEIMYEKQMEIQAHTQQITVLNGQLESTRLENNMLKTQCLDLTERYYKQGEELDAIQNKQDGLTTTTLPPPNFTRSITCRQSHQCHHQGGHETDVSIISADSSTEDTASIATSSDPNLIPAQLEQHNMHDLLEYFTGLLTEREKELFEMKDTAEHLQKVVDKSMKENKQFKNNQTQLQKLVDNQHILIQRLEKEADRSMLSVDDTEGTVRGESVIATPRHANGVARFNHSPRTSQEAEYAIAVKELQGTNAKLMQEKGALDDRVDRLVVVTDQLKAELMESRKRATAYEEENQGLVEQLRKEADRYWSTVQNLTERLSTPRRAGPSSTLAQDPT